MQGFGNSEKMQCRRERKSEREKEREVKQQNMAAKKDRQTETN